MDRLPESLKTIKYYPEGLMEINCEIAGLGFFPGARGIVDPMTSLSDKNIMVLGHDFGNHSDYSRSIERGQENMKALTWKNMLDMLKIYVVDPNDCFFTNILLGARTIGRAVGKNPAYSDDRYMRQCCDFFLHQLEVQRPKLVMVLGIHALRILARLSPTLENLASIRGFKQLDQIGAGLCNDVSFNQKTGLKTNVVFVTHPTYWHLNVRHRRYMELEGADAEKKMIQKAQQKG